MKKCFLPCNLLLIMLLISACASDPVYISDKIDVNELWNHSENTVSTESAEETEPEWDGVTVYYTESGSVWHTSVDCSALKRSQNVMVGTQEQAESEGKERACKKCT